jgi:tetratricopeptide (TPR) repeat protein
LGRSHDLAGELEAAAARYRLVVNGGGFRAIRAKNDLARILILRHLQDREKLQEAIALTSEVLTILQFGDSPDQGQIEYAAHKNRGWAHLALGDLERAEADFRQGIQAFPERPDAYCLLAQLLDLRGDPEALSYWQSCLELPSALGLNELNGWRTNALLQLRDQGKLP